MLDCFTVSNLLSKPDTANLGGLRRSCAPPQTAQQTCKHDSHPERQGAKRYVLPQLGC